MVVGEFLFLVTKNLKSRRLDLLSNHEICFQNFSFSSRNWRKLQISRLFFLQKWSLSSRTRKQILTFLFSLLKIRDMDSIFLFLFLISLFGISSMPGTNARISKKFIRRHLLIKFACYKVPPVMVPTHGSVVPLAMFFLLKTSLREVIRNGIFKVRLTVREGRGGQPPRP